MMIQKEMHVFKEYQFIKLELAGSNILKSPSIKHPPFK